MSRYDYFVDVHLWPLRDRLNPQLWLSNFPPDEQKLAHRLLEGFVYYSRPLVAQMFRGAFANISQFIVKNKSNHLAASTEWARFLKSVKIVRVTGEEPNDTDSGYIFARLARDFLGIDQTQILSPAEVVESMIRNPRQGVVFVDDFVGSGNQFLSTWTREYPVGAHQYSFKAISDASPTPNSIFYAPIICTEKGKAAIASAAPTVRVVAAHVIGTRYSVLSPDSIIWGDMSNEGPSFVREASARAGIPHKNGGLGCWTGFHSLGLALAFEHGWPDSTIPLLYFDENGWKPLLRAANA
jgi:hypothetical protein